MLCEFGTDLYQAVIDLEVLILVLMEDALRVQAFGTTVESKLS